MKIKLIIALLLVTFAVKAQDVSYKFTGPVSQSRKVVYGNEDNGFILIDGGKEIVVSTLNKSDNTWKKTNNSFKNIFTSTNFKFVAIFNEAIYYIYIDNDMMKAKGFDYKGNVIEKVELIDLNDLACNLRSQMYNFSINNNNQFVFEYYSYLERPNEVGVINLKETPKVYYKIFDSSLNLLAECEKELEKKIYSFNLKDLYYNTEDSKVYGRYLYDEKYDKEYEYGVIVVENNSNVKLIKDSDIELGINNLMKVEDKNIMFGIKVDGISQKAYVFTDEFDGKLNAIDQGEFPFSFHPNFKDRKADDEIKFSYSLVDIKHLDDGSFVTCHKLRMDMGSSIHNILFTKFNSDGEIQFSNTLPIAGLTHFDHNNFTVDEDFIRIVYVDFLDHLTIANIKYDGKYVMAALINSDGEKETKILFNSEKREKMSLYNVFDSSYSPDKYTFITRAYKKKKEDMIIEVKFAD